MASGFRNVCAVASVPFSVSLAKAEAAAVTASAPIARCDSGRCKTGATSSTERALFNGERNVIVKIVSNMNARRIIQTQPT